MFSALLPVFLLIALGWLLGRFEFPSREFWAGAARLTYFLLLPALLVVKLSRPELALAELGGQAWPLLVGTLGVALALYLAAPKLGPGPAFTSVLQGGVRVNTYIALAVSGTLFGDRGVQLAAIFLGLLIPLVNILSVSALHRFGKAQDGPLLKKLLTNPLLCACFVGGSLNLLGLPLIGPLEGILEILGRAALPLGLMTVGAGLRPLGQKHSTALVLSCLAKLLILPMAVMGLALIASIPNQVAIVLVVCAAVPTSASSYILASEMGGDKELMATLITLQTVLACVTLPLLVSL